VDITRDVMQMYAEGKPIAEIYAAIEARYSVYGPSTGP